MGAQLLSAEKREAVKHGCAIVVGLARDVFRREIHYDDDSIKWLASLIEFLRKKPHEQQLKQNVLNSIGCFLGEALIARYGGDWVTTDDGAMAVRLPSQTVAFPFIKVSKHFKNGDSDSIWAMFKMGDPATKNSRR